MSVFRETYAAIQIGDLQLATMKLIDLHEAEENPISYIQAKNQVEKVNRNINAGRKKRVYERRHNSKRS